MTDTTSSGSPVREAPLGPDGEVEIFLTSNELRLRGTDGDRVVVRARDGSDLEREVSVEAGPSAVRIRDAHSTRLRIGPLVMHTGRAPDLDIDVPRTARLSVRTLSGDVVALGIGGASHWATASGELRIQADAGPLSVESMSGDVTIDASVALELSARSVSGELRVRAPRLLRLDASTTSGDVDVDADLSEGETGSISSVSGDVRLAMGGDLRLDAKTVTGDVRASVPHRAEGGRGHRTLIVGDGRAHVSVRTMSGDIFLRDRSPRGTSLPDPVEAPAPPAAPAPAGAPAPLEPQTAPPVPPRPVEPPVLVAEAEAAPNLVRPDTAGPVLGDAGSTDRRESARLEVLRALERGELDVDTASRRLEALESAGPRSFRGWC
ncbi:MAG: hypothetical protein A2V85_17790 [Chloroflexi bacterium RBG_16_72_14]|nr:MAG: hypothetical protein A2V85_17790 [Chloroflexi bacterium RBG_16_72_14]